MPNSGPNLGPNTGPNPGSAAALRGPSHGPSHGTVKITDVAAHAGVAPMTVSRVLNAPERVTKETALRVRAAIAELGYVPNLVAGGLSSRRSRMIAAIVPTIATPVFADCIGSFTDALEFAGYHVVLGLSGYREEREDKLIGAFLGRQPDGLLLTGAAHSAATLRRVARAGIPLVEIWDAVAEPADMLVGFDHASVGEAVAAFFAEAGHRDFAVIAADDPRARARRDGFVAEFGRRGGTLVAEQRLAAPGSILAGREAARMLLPKLAGRTALFCSSDMVAAGALLEARDAGHAVPDRIAICGFGDFELGRALTPAITTVKVESAAIGALSAALLLRRLRGESVTARTLVPFAIERRGSA